MEIVDPSYFYTERRWKSLQNPLKKDSLEFDHGNSNKSGFNSNSRYFVLENYKFGMAGCVALEKKGIWPQQPQLEK